MKKVICFMMAFGFSLSLVFASELIPIKVKVIPQLSIQENRVVNPMSFLCDPVSLQFSYYDSGIGGHNLYPLIYSPFDNHSILTFTLKSGISSEKLYPIANIDDNGSFNISNNTFPNQGSIAVSRTNNTLLAAFHKLNSTTGRHEIGISNLSLIQIPEFPTDPQYFYPDQTDDYFSPQIYISISPNPGMNRLYVIAFSTETAQSGYPSSMVKLAYADFNEEILLNNTPFEFTIRSFSYLEGMDNDVNVHRAFLSLAISQNGKVALCGRVLSEASFADAENPNLVYEPHNYVVIYNDNFGEGDFSTHTYMIERELEPPVNQDGSLDPDLANFTDLKVELGHNFRNNCVFDLQGNLHFPALSYVTYKENGEYKYWPTTQFVNDLVFDPTNQSVNVKPIWPQGLPGDHQLLCPWDLDNDAQVDSFEAGTGHWMFSHYSYPYEYWNIDNSNQYQYIRMSEPDENGHFSVLWLDTMKSQWFHDYDDQQYQAYANVPEIYISNYNGLWSEPNILNSINTPEISGMIPSNVYLSNQTRSNGAGSIRQDILFYDDESFGAYVLNGDGENLGGTVKFMSLGFSSVANQDPVNIRPGLLSQNYPNPFNPTTTISYNLPATGKIKLSVYNIKGQVIQTLVNEVQEKGTHSVVWNGKNNQQQAVSSGVYFYRIQAGNHSEMRKMLLVK